VITKSGEEIFVQNPANFPDYGNIKESYEPMINAVMIFPNEYLGTVIGLCQVIFFFFSLPSYLFLLKILQ